MNFKKLALASAIAAMPVGALALDEIADEALSEVTGQDGIELVFQTSTGGVQTDIYIHDTDGLVGLVGASSSYSFAGAIVIDDMKMMVGGNSITISIDAGVNARSVGAPVLNVNVGLPTALTISTGAIKVANSQRDDGVAGWSIDTLSSTIMNNMTIVLGSTQLNIQLGNEAQTGSVSGADMMVLSASVTSGIQMSGFRLNDATGAGDGGIGASVMTILDNAGTNLTLGLDINADDTGLVIGFGQFGHATNGADIRIVDQYLGSTSAGTIGDISIVGLNLNGATLTISGK